MNLDILFENFEMLADAAKGVPKLREMIFQMAVQGKLVPQDPNDEPASVLLKKIKAEKDRLIREKKIKKKKPILAIIPDEIPHELPGSWEWTKLAVIGLINPRNEIADGKEVSFIPMKLVPTVLGNQIESENRAWKDIKKGFTHFAEGDVAIAKITPCFQNRKSVVMRNLINGFGAGTTELHIFRSINEQIIPEYVLIFLKTPKFIFDGVGRMTGSAGQKRVPKTYFSENPFPLPPLNEQKRIVAKVDQLMVLCDELEARKQKRDESRIALNDAALDRLLSAREQKDFTKHWNRISNNFDLLYDNPENVDKLRQAILQLAVQGKLVPQDPNDLPASVLIEKIKAEKERLIKEKKIKKTKPLPPITPEEIPYELPLGWTWSRMPEVVSFTENAIKRGPFGSSIRKAFFVPEGYKVYEQKNAIYNDFDLGNYYINENKFIELKNFEVKPNDIIISCSGTIGKVAIAPEKIQKGIINQALLKLSLNLEILINEYFVILFPAFFMKTSTLTDLKGTAMKNIVSVKILKSLPFPLPPAQEQKRIVKKVEQLMALCDEFESKLSQSQSNCDEMLTAIVSNIENVSVKKFSTSRKTKTNKTDPIEERINTPEKKKASISKPQRKSEKRFDKLKILKAFRKAIFQQNNIDELNLLRLVGQHLDIKRLSQPIRQELESYINTAIRREILYRDGDGYSAGTPTIEHYDDDFLIKVLRSVTRKGWEYQREHLVEESANYLGFDKVSNAFKYRMKSVFRKALREKALYRNREYVGKM